MQTGGDRRGITVHQKALAVVQCRKRNRAHDRNVRDDADHGTPDRPRPSGAFIATLVAFFIAEIGDKTQITTVALAAAYANLFAVVAGTTAGMLLANAPVVFIGKAFSERLPLRALQRVASASFLVLGVLFIYRALGHTVHP